MRSAIITCDICGRREDDEGHRGWALLAIPEQGPRDVCRACLAQMLGWKSALNGRSA